MNEIYFKEVISTLNKKIESLERRIEKLSETKAPSKIFYIFITTFSVLYIYGMVRIYQQTNENTLVFQKGIAGVRVTQTELKERLTYTSIKTDHVEEAVIRMQDKLEKAIQDIRKEIRDKK